MSTLASLLLGKETLTYSPPSKPIDIAGQWYYFVKQALSVASSISVLTFFDFLSDENITIDVGGEKISIPIYSYLMSLLSMNTMQTGLALKLEQSRGTRLPPLEVLLRETPEAVARIALPMLYSLQQILNMCKMDYDRQKQIRYSMSDEEYEASKKRILLFAKDQIDFFLSSLNQVILSVLSTKTTEVSSKASIEMPVLTQRREQ